MSKIAFYRHLDQEIALLKEQGLFKGERVITTPQSSHIGVVDHPNVINLCANNYLGLADDEGLILAAKKALDEYGYGMASVRFICGTQTIHKELEIAISEFVGMEDTILYSSCFDANTGLFETLLGDQDAIISDELNHASIIDGIRLCKAARFRYKNNDMTDLEEKLKAAQSARFRLIVTDGVFSMDGIVANLEAICDLADRYDALVMVDDSHAVGFMGEKGRGTLEHCGVLGRVDMVTGTLGKALGGASGGYTSGRQELITWLRERSRPSLFSNSLAPMIAATSLAVLKRLISSSELKNQLHKNAAYFRCGMEKLGFNLIPGSHPIIPVMIGDAVMAKRFADALLAEGVYVIAFSYPVVPHGKARIRTQMSAKLSQADLDQALGAFKKVGLRLGLIS